MRRILSCTIAAAVAAAGAFVAGPGSSGAASSQSVTAASGDYVVVYAAGASAAAARRAIEDSGGTIVQENTSLGYAVVRSDSARFRSAAAEATALVGAARNRVIGMAPRLRRAPAEDIERLLKERDALSGTDGVSDAVPARRALAEPLANRQWNMRQIGASPSGSYAETQGNRRVLVGIIDTGVDGRHPDIAPNFAGKLSANFTVDNPFIDGECEVPSCVDPANVDDHSHGTHVASIIGSPINDLGVAGVAPKVGLVNIRAGQDSGYFFLQPTLEALTYAGDIGVDVVNMSYYVDPWLFNCLSHPADSPAEQSEQRVIRTAVQRAVNYAVGHNVTPVASEGNGATNLDHPKIDETSPDFPPGSEKRRKISNACVTVPTETRGTVPVSATGPSTRKAYYSNFGLEQTVVAAPGGDYYDSADNTGDPRNMVLAAYPRRVARLNGELNDDGTPNTPFVVRDCDADRCGYYTYYQGTSMASPHAAGVAALVVSQHGSVGDGARSWTLEPTVTKRMLRDTAVPHACPEPRRYRYRLRQTDGSVARLSAYCAGPIAKNGFYGHGIVNADKAASAPR
jgi:subtilisin family serine protease